jgi:hypothetical protein
MTDVSVLDLFWLILKFLVALGLVCLLLFAAYLICRLAFKMLRSIPTFISGKASTAVTVAWVLILVAIATFATFWFKK